MKELSISEMKNISGGGTISGSLFSALAKGFNVFVVWEEPLVQV